MTSTHFNLQVDTHMDALNGFAIQFTKDINTANDLVQDTMLKAVKFFHLFEEGSNLRGWLFTIMKNTYINSFNKEVRTSALIKQVDEITFAQLLWSAKRNDSENKFLRNDIKQAFSYLSEPLYQIFTRYVKGYKYQEIADEFGLPIGTVKTRIFEARKILRKKLNDYEPGFL